jgi:DNA polymerase
MEMLYGKGSTAEVDKIMGTPVPWAKGLPLKAESFETEFYKKD